MSSSSVIPWASKIGGLFLGVSLLFFGVTSVVSAYNILEYKDTISDSGPSALANHTLSFIINTDLSAGSVLEITPPPGFTVLGSSTLDARIVELWEDGTPRTSGPTALPGVDGVEVTSGSPGFIRYTLAPDSGIVAGSRLEMRIGNHTSTALPPSLVYSTSTGTTTVPGDAQAITNASTTGLHKVAMEIYDGGLVAETEFLIFINEKVGIVGIDTRETVPPLRFDGSPTSSVGGTTPFVEISLETDEFAICRFSTASGTPYMSMTSNFTNTQGMVYHVYHTTVVPVTPGTIAQFYVRCIDDEGNINTDDYLIQFIVNEQPTGQANEEGDVDGDGSGTGNEGSGDGSGSGGETGDSSGETPLLGGSAGTGGSGGGSGGGGGGSSGSSAGGGFESQDAPYRSGDGRVIISGYAYPNSTVTALVDGTLFTTTRANDSGVYSVTLDEIARGVYTFGVYAEGSDDVKSSTFSTSFTVTGARTSSLGNINIPPSINVDPDPVDPGETLTLSGYALPDATVTVELGRRNQAPQQTLTVVSNDSGRWSIEADTDGFAVDTYQVRAKAEQEAGATTNFSNHKFFGVGQTADVPINTDLNRDGKVNLIDFSIMLFWWNTNGGDSDPPADINRDGRVNLVDFSILLFNWTG